MTVKNGRLPSSSLATIPGTSQQIAVVLVPQVVALRAAFKAQFHKPLTITSAYRSYAAQVAARSRYLLGLGAYAVPAGTSNHGWGMAIDFGSGVATYGSDEWRWMVANAPRYGFNWLRVAGNGSIEPWHFDGHYVSASNYLSTPTPNPAEDDLPYTPEEIKGLTQAGAHQAVYNLWKEPEIKNIIRDVVREAVFEYMLPEHPELKGEARRVRTLLSDVRRNTANLVRKLV